MDSKDASPTNKPFLYQDPYILLQQEVSVKWLGVVYPEVLKAAIMQSHDCAKYLRICANFGLMNAKLDKLALISCICHNSCICHSFSSLYVFFYACFCAKFSIRAFWLRKRKYGSVLISSSIYIYELLWYATRCVAHHQHCFVNPFGRAHSVWYQHKQIPLFWIQNEKKYKDQGWWGHSIWGPKLFT